MLLFHEGGVVGACRVATTILQGLVLYGGALLIFCRGGAWWSASI